ISAYPEQYQQYSHLVFGPRKCGGNRWNFVPRCHRTLYTVLYVIYELKYICHRFCGRHFGFSGGTRVAKDLPFCSPIIFRKSHQRVPLNSKRFRNGSKKMGKGVIFPPPPLAIERLSRRRKRVEEMSNNT